MDGYWICLSVTVPWLQGCRDLLFVSIQRNRAWGCSWGIHVMLGLMPKVIKEEQG